MPPRFCNFLLRRIDTMRLEKPYTNATHNPAFQLQKRFKWNGKLPSDWRRVKPHMNDNFLRPLGICIPAIFRIIVIHLLLLLSTNKTILLVCVCVCVRVTMLRLFDEQYNSLLLKIPFILLSMNYGNISFAASGEKMIEIPQCSQQRKRVRNAPFIRVYHIIN